MKQMLRVVLLLLIAAAVLSSAIPVSKYEDCKKGFVDASTRTQDGSTYLFQGDYYWKYIDSGIEFGYPRLISNDWKGVHGPIDAAVTWDGGSTFIFKGENYWRFQNKVAFPGYPRKIADGFSGIPNNIDAALVWGSNGYTYFFKGDKYWRYMPHALNPTIGNYPASISAWVGVPNDLDAAIRWEHGSTYFFKGANYYKYDSAIERVPSTYPVSTANAWFKCDIPTKNLENFERELPKTAVKIPNKIIVDKNDINDMIKEYSKQQRIHQIGMQLAKVDVVKEIPYKPAK